MVVQTWILALRRMEQCNGFKTRDKAKPGFQFLFSVCSCTCSPPLPSSMRLSLTLFLCLSLCLPFSLSLSLSISKYIQEAPVHLQLGTKTKPISFLLPILVLECKENLGIPAVYSSAPLRSFVTLPESFYFEDFSFLMYNINKWNAFCLPEHVIFWTTGLCSNCEMGECILPSFQWCPGKYLKTASLKASKPGTKSKHKQANKKLPMICSICQYLWYKSSQQQLPWVIGCRTGMTCEVGMDNLLGTVQHNNMTSSRSDQEPTEWRQIIPQMTH